MQAELSERSKRAKLLGRFAYDVAVATLGRLIATWVRWLL